MSLKIIIEFSEVAYCMMLLTISCLCFITVVFVFSVIFYHRWSSSPLHANQQNTCSLAGLGSHCGRALAPAPAPELSSTHSLAPAPAPELSSTYPLAPAPALQLFNKQVVYHLVFKSFFAINYSIRTRITTSDLYNYINQI